MKNLLKLFIFSSIAFMLLYSCTLKEEPKRPEYVIVIHGGAGNASTKDINEERQQEYKEKLGEALAIGEKILAEGGTSIEAIEKAINYLEDCPLFNAGKGAVFTHEGTNEMDASIMDGSNLNAGAVAGVGDIKNPISAAIQVMNNSEHVMLAGKGASDFARAQGIEIVDSSYFHVQDRWESLQRILKAEKHGTVGCVALDKQGNLAAGTSTGGRTNKKFGRIGDSPIIGAGNYANNNTCAISATGHGEYFIRYTVAHDISALMEYKNLSLEEASNIVIHQKLVKAGGDGGIIAVDREGNIAMPFNTNMMFRAYSKSSGEREIAIFK
ncbi:MAG: isoaspartyl peptidase/L-asparaginase [Bacteroidales bacterium]|jgi:beta-aspartyl-peptidase (threonine type)|nr:isoaspartyl peptidase/L-asparaginase [Bacteroidales bacterium]